MVYNFYTDMWANMAKQPQFLNYEAKQPHFQTMQQNIIVLKLNIADVEFKVEFDISKVEFYDNFATSMF